MGCGSSVPPPDPRLIGEWYFCDGNDGDVVNQYLALKRLLGQETSMSYYKIAKFSYKHHSGDASIAIIRQDGWMRYLQVTGGNAMCYAGPITQWKGEAWVGCCPGCGGCISFEGELQPTRDARQLILILNGRQLKKTTSQAGPKQ